MILERVISGGQTGADQAGWRAAQRFSIPTGGWMPKGYLTEDGPRPAFAQLYGARETMTTGYPERTRLNARDGKVTLWFGNSFGREARLTIKSCRGPWLVVDDRHKDHDHPPDKIAEWLSQPSLVGGVLNVAGNRESASPGIGRWVEIFLVEAFGLMGFSEQWRDV